MSREQAGSLIFLFVGIYGIFFSIHYPMGKWSEPDAGVFPLGLSILLSLSGIFWFIMGKAKGKKAGIHWRGILKDLIIPLKIVGLTGIFILGLQPAGYLAASMLYLFLLFFWISRYKFTTSMCLAVLFGAGSWYFFVKLMAVQLPGGFLPP